MMKKSRVLSILLLVLSLHACSARSISFSGKQADNSQDLIKISSTHERLLAKYENSNYEDNKLNQFLLVMKRNLKAHDEVKKEYNKELDEIIETTFQTSQERAVEEKWKKEARRSTLQSLPNGNNNAKPEDTMNYSPNENEGPEEAVVMDYAQPHRKPPIHNKEP